MAAGDAAGPAYTVLDYEVEPRVVPACGLIVLAADETIEPELAPLFAAAGLPLHCSRIASASEVTPATLRAMEAALPEAARLLPGSAGLASVGYGCTSGATVIGPDRVAAAIGACHPSAAVTDPLSALTAACRALGVRRLGMLTPYLPEVTRALRAALAERGVEVVALASFEERHEARVARIPPGRVREALLALGAAPVDAVFASCTNLRSLGVLADVEHRLARPALSSNSVLAWHMAALAGARLPGPGALFGLPAPG